MEEQVSQKLIYGSNDIIYFYVGSPNVKWFSKEKCAKKQPIFYQIDSKKLSWYINLDLQQKNKYQVINSLPFSSRFQTFWHYIYICLGHQLSAKQAGKALLMSQQKKNWRRAGSCYITCCTLNQVYVLGIVDSRQFHVCGCVWWVLYPQMRCVETSQHYGIHNNNNGSGFCHRPHNDFNIKQHPPYNFFYFKNKDRVNVFGKNSYKNQVLIQVF